MYLLVDPVDFKGSEALIECLHLELGVSQFEFAETCISARNEAVVEIDQALFSIRSTVLCNVSTKKTSSNTAVVRD